MNVLVKVTVPNNRAEAKSTQTEAKYFHAKAS